MNDPDIQRVHSAITSLVEHFDTVQIFATRHENDSTGTVTVNLGAGNWFARYGQIKAWVIKEDEAARAISRKHNS